MKKILLCAVLLTFSLVINTTNLFANTCNLKVSSNNRFLVHEDGTKFFPMGDTCWEIPWDLNRSEVETYLETRKNQHFNLIGINSFDWDQSRNSTNKYGDQPFQIVSGKYDPTQPITTPGNDPNNAGEYDYWDHLEYIIDLAASKGIYVALLPTWGDSRIVDESDPNSQSRIFDLTNAYTYGQWIGDRFKDKTNIIWILGGDTPPEGYKDTFRKMAEGIADGVNGVNNNDGNADYSTTLMSYHASRWSYSSSYYFPSDAFMDFNSVQCVPETQINRMNTDYALTPAKATWIFEGLYENRVEDPGTYGAWQCRFQAYQSVFAGAFGHTYGNMSIWDFDSDWNSHLNDTGSEDMQHLCSLMNSLTDAQFLNRIPDQGLLTGDTGEFSELHGYKSSCIVATRTTTKDIALIYTASGKDIQVKMSQLMNGTMRARWYDPRNGTYSTISTNIPSGTGASNYTFDPQGSESDGNDYVLVLDESGSGPDPGPGPGAITNALHVSSNGRYLENGSGEPVFLQCDWALAMPWAATTGDISTYLTTRASQGFNAIAIQAMDKQENTADDYATFENKAGDKPFQLQSSGDDYPGHWDLTKPVEGYWSLIDTIIDTAASKGMYVVLGAIPVKNCIKAGSDYRCMNRDDAGTAYAYGNWLGDRYADKTNIIWLAGFGEASSDGIDVTATVDALAKGIADGVNGVSNNYGSTDYSTTLMTYTSERWADNASAWFNDEDWLDFNTVYEVPGRTDHPEDQQVTKITSDYALTPAKPTFLLGPCWEHQRKSTIFTASQCRFQMYQSFLAGGVVGVTYGNRYCALFDSANNWSSELTSTAAGQIQYAKTVLEPLMTSMVPDQDLLSSSTSQGETSKGAGQDYYWAQSTIIQAARTANGSNAVIYSAYGNTFTVRMQYLTYSNAMKAEWFNPRTGAKTLISNTIQSGAGAPNYEFDPSGDPAQDNDAVLVLTAAVPEPTFIIGGLLFALALFRRK